MALSFQHFYRKTVRLLMSVSVARVRHQQQFRSGSMRSDSCCSNPSSTSCCKHNRRLLLLFLSPRFFCLLSGFLSKLNTFEGCCQLATSQISIFVKIKPFLLQPHNICCEPHNRELLILTRFIISFYFNPTLVTRILK